MAIIKKQRNPEGTKEVTFIGILVPKEVSSFLLLYTLAEGVTKTSVILDLLQQWKNKRTETESDFIEQIVAKSLYEWHHYPFRKTTFYAFCHRLRLEFKNAKLEQRIIDIIIKKLINEKNSEK
jgi:hypothetical protein